MANLAVFQTLPSGFKVDPPQPQPQAQPVKAQQSAPVFATLPEGFTVDAPEQPKPDGIDTRDPEAVKKAVLDHMMSNAAGFAGRDMNQFAPPQGKDPMASPAEMDAVRAGGPISQQVGVKPLTTSERMFADAGKRVMKYHPNDVLGAAKDWGVAGATALAALPVAGYEWATDPNKSAYDRQGDVARFLMESTGTPAAMRARIAGLDDKTLPAEMQRGENYDPTGDILSLGLGTAFAVPAELGAKGSSSIARSALSNVTGGASDLVIGGGRLATQGGKAAFKAADRIGGRVRPVVPPPGPVAPAAAPFSPLPILKGKVISRGPPTGPVQPPSGDLPRQLGAPPPATPDPAVGPLPGTPGGPARPVPQIKRPAASLEPTGQPVLNLEQRRKAIKIIAKTLRQAGVTPDEIEAELTRRALNGTPLFETFAEFAGPQAKAMQTALGVVPGPAKEALQKTFSDSVRGLPDDLMATAKKTTKIDPANFYAEKAKQEAARKERDAANYAGVFYGENGEALRPPADAFDIKLFNPDPARPELAPVAYRPAFQNYVAKALKAATDQGDGALKGELGSFLNDIKNGGKPNQPLTTRAINEIDKRIGSDAHAATISGDRAGARDLLDLQEALRVTDHDTGLGNVRTQAHVGLTAQEGFDAGRDAFRRGVDIEEVGQWLGGHEEVSSAYMTGMVRAMADSLANQTNLGGLADAANKIAATPLLRDKITALLPKTQAGRLTVASGRFLEVLNRISAHVEQARTMYGNSATALRHAAIDAAEEATSSASSDAVDLIGELLTLDKGALYKRAGDRIKNQITRPSIYNPKVNKELGSIVGARGKDEIKSVLDEIRAHEASRKGRPPPPSGGPPPTTGPNPVASPSPKGPPKQNGMMLGGAGGRVGGAALAAGALPIPLDVNNDGKVDGTDIAINAMARLGAGAVAYKALRGRRSPPVSGGRAPVQDTFGGLVGARNLAAKGEMRPQQALDMAAAMEKQGADKDAIWKATAKHLEGTPYIGVHKGADGKWRFEIDDSGSSLTTTGKQEILGPLSGVLRDADARGAYPDIKDTRTAILPYRGGGVYSKADGQPLLVAGTQEGRKVGHSTLMHERQHLIQDIEQYAPGGTAENADQWTPEFAAWAAARNKLPEQEVNALYRRIPSPNDAYKRLAGETEARNVEARMKMTPDQRRASPPWQTQDVPDDQQIIRFGSNGPQAMFPFKGKGEPPKGPTEPPLPPNPAGMPPPRGGKLPPGMAGLPMQAGIAGAGAAGAAMLGSPDAEAQTAPDGALVRDAQDRAAKARSRVDQLQADLDAFDKMSATQKQEMLVGLGYKLGNTGPKRNGVDGNILGMTQPAIADYKAKRAGEIRQAKDEADAQEKTAKDYQMQGTYANHPDNPMMDAVRNFGPKALGLAAIAYGGHLRGKAVAKAAEKTLMRNAMADALINTSPVTKGRSAADKIAYNKRFENLNNYAIMGGAGENVPFKSVTGGKKPGSYAPRPHAAEFSTLFPPEGNAHFRPADGYLLAGSAADVGIFGTAAADAHKDVEDAKKELKAAQDSGSSARIDIALSKLETAKNLLAIYETMAFAGLGMGTGRLVETGRIPYKHIRPNSISDAGAERTALLKSLK